jgi:hypothetical protein
MSAICVKNGTYRNKPVRNQEFVLVSGFQTGAKGNYVTVKKEALNVVYRTNMLRIEFKDPNNPENNFGTLKDVDGTEYVATEI